MSKIEWTNETWNPIIGCTKVSEGCQNCYGEKMALRLSQIEKTEYYNHVINLTHHIGLTKPKSKSRYKSAKWSGKTYFVESQLKKPLKRKKPTMYFICSMGDLFHESVNFEDIIEVFHVINKCPQHTFQILTKRPERMKDFFVNYAPNPYWENLPNVWLGVTTENQEQAEKRIPILLQIPATVRFVSCEPLLESIDFHLIGDNFFHNVLTGKFICEGMNETCISEKLDWIITGGESGHKARPMHPDWVRSIRDQCKEADVPFFFKQWGEYAPMEKTGFAECGEYIPGDDNHYKVWLTDGIIKILPIKWFGPVFTKGSQIMYKVGKKKAGCLLDGKEYKQFPKTQSVTL